MGVAATGALATVAAIARQPPFVAHTLTVAVPTAVPRNFSTFALEMFAENGVPGLDESVYEPLPPEIIRLRSCPTFNICVSASEETGVVTDEPLTVTVRMAHPPPDWQTVIVAVPSALPVTIRLLPLTMAEATELLLFEDTAYPPAPERATFADCPLFSVSVLWPSVNESVPAAATVTERLEHPPFEAHSASTAEPFELPYNVSVVPTIFACTTELL